VILRSDGRSQSPKHSPWMPLARGTRALIVLVVVCEYCESGDISMARVKRLSGFVSVCILAAASMQANAASILVVDGGTGVLLGADNVSVGGLGLFDVRFREGTCASVFNGCDSVTDFTFSNFSDAQDAAEALLTDVFVGIFDTDPTLTFGCAEGTPCISWTPWGFNAGNTLVFRTYNSPIELAIFDTTEFGAQAPADDTTTFGLSVNWAVWTPPAAVPIPAALWLFGSGLGMLGWIMRRQTA